MFSAFVQFPRTLRFRLVAASSILLLVAFGALVYNSVRLMDRHLLEQENRQLQEREVLYSAALTPPLVRRDDAALDEAIRQLRKDQGLEYLIVVDPGEQILAMHGWDTTVPLPPRMKNFTAMPRDAEQFHGSLALREGERIVGYFLYGQSEHALRVARFELVRQSIVIGGIAFILAVLLLDAIAAWMTRDLRRLKRGVAGLEQGGRQVKLPVRGFDEVGALTRAINSMSQRLEERVEALKQSEARFHAIADYTYGVEAWFNPRGRLIWVNRSIQRVTGYTPLECILAGNLADMLVYAKDRKHVLEEALRAHKGGSGENFELRLQRKDGSIVWVALNWQAIFGPDGKYLGLRVSANEIQGRKEAELKLLQTVAELRRAQALKDYYLKRSDEERRRLEALLNVMKVGVLFIDRDRRVLFCNRVLKRIWGIDEKEELTGMREDALLERTAALRADDAAFRRHVQDIDEQGANGTAFEAPLKDGRTIADVSALVPGTESGQFIGRVWIYEDVTEQKRMEQRLIQLAEHDPLTNLYNRRRFHEELERMLADAARRRTQLGLLVIDLDGFKPINDEFGHQAGDDVLTTLADAVGSTVRRNEMFFRLGGDEFAILAPDSSENDMIGLARRVGGRIAELRFRFGEREAHLTASLGIAIYPNHAGNGEEMVAHADHAMYQAKAGGRNCWQVYRDPTLH